MNDLGKVKQIEIRIFLEFCARGNLFEEAVAVRPELIRESMVADETAAAAE